MGLVTLGEVKEFAGVPSTDTSNDSFLQMQIDMISEAVEAFCRRRFRKATWSETFLWTSARTPTLTTTHYPVIEVVSVSDSAYEDVWVHKPTGLIRPRNAYAFLGDREDITVVYKAGYEDADLPKPLKFAVLSLVTGNLNKKKSGVDLSFGSDVQRVSIPGTISIDFDYSLQNNEPNRQFGLILGNMANVIAPYVSDRAIVGNDKITYLDEVP